MFWVHNLVILLRCALKDVFVFSRLIHVGCNKQKSGRRIEKFCSSIPTDALVRTCRTLNDVNGDGREADLHSHVFNVGNVTGHHLT
jgi:hypothetical protein